MPPSHEPCVSCMPPHAWHEPPALPQEGRVSGPDLVSGLSVGCDTKVAHAIPGRQTGSLCKLCC